MNKLFSPSFILKIFERDELNRLFTMTTFEALFNSIVEFTRCIS